MRIRFDRETRLREAGGGAATPPDDLAAFARPPGPVMYAPRIADPAGVALGEHEVVSVPVALGEHEVVSVPVALGEHERVSAPVALGEHEVVSVPVALGAAERRRYRELRGRFAASYAAFQRRMPDAAWREFVRASSQTAQGRAALAAWREYRALLAYPDGKRAALREILRRHRGSRALVFTADNATAYAIARELLVVPMTHEIRRGERTRAIAGFASGECPVLVSSQVLEDGRDVPGADLAIVMGGSASPRRHVQRVGRVLRPRDGQRALIYELAVCDTTGAAEVVHRRAGVDSRAAVEAGGSP